MASLSTNASGNRRIMFKAPDGQRKTHYLGKAQVKQAQAILAHVERLVACGIDGSAPPEATAHWLAACSVELRSKLAAVGLAPEAVSKETVTVGKLVERYQARPKWKNLKPATQRCVTRCLLHLLRHFDPETPIEKITAADANDFYEGLRLAKSEGGHGLAVATANLTASIVTTMFFYAVDAELIGRNVFRKLPRSDRRGNNTMVDAKASELVLAAIQGTENRLLFWLARWGGVRTMSEQRGLRWGHVDWEGKRLRIASPKTERHEGKEARWIPLFPELAKLLEDRFDEANPVDEWILPSYHHASSFKATTMLRNARSSGPGWYHGAVCSTASERRDRAS